MATDTVSVRIARDTKLRVDGAKVYPRETLDDVIRRLLNEREQRKTAEDQRAS